MLVQIVKPPPLPQPENKIIAELTLTEARILAYRCYTNGDVTLVRNYIERYCNVSYTEAEVQAVINNFYNQVRGKL